MRKSEAIILIIIFLSFAFGINIYHCMPDMMASHWNFQGQVDGYMPKFWGLFLMPIITMALLLLFIFIPRIDPLKENIKKFRKYFDGFIVLLVLFMFCLYVLTILWNLGLRFSMNRLLSAALGILFFYSGVLVENARRNWFIGIRTPWTLSSESVWDKTHRLGGKLFKASGIIAFLGIFFPDYLFWLVFIPLIVASVYLTFYSYFEYRKEKGN